MFRSNEDTVIQVTVILLQVVVILKMLPRNVYATNYLTHGVVNQLRIVRFLTFVMMIIFVINCC